MTDCTLYDPQYHAQIYTNPCAPSTLPQGSSTGFSEYPVASRTSSPTKSLGRLVYECYKPKKLEEVKEYIQFVLEHRTIIANEVGEEADSELNESKSAPDISFDNPPLGLSHKLVGYLKGIAERRKDPRNVRNLWFDSNFECGNLERVIAKSETEYELYLNSDTNAVNRSQWFYFRVENTKASQTARFTIMNQTKSSYFYIEGVMRPTVFSEAQYKKMRTSWTNDNITDCTVSKVSAGSRSYGARIISLDPDDYELELPAQPPPSYHTLSFSYTFQHDNDIVYFAFCKPYSFTRLRHVLSKVETHLFQDPVSATCNNVDSKPEIQIETKEVFYRRTQLSTSLGGVPVEAITISAPGNRSKRRYVVVTARVHAAETPGSYKVQGILEFLFGSDKIVASLRQQYIFLIVPMLNPDGVIMGNSRYSIEGDDLNRCWGSPSPDKHPAIYSLKELLRTLTAVKGQEIKVYCDLHGHSKQYNAFIYACHQVSNATFCSWTKTRLLPRILAKKCSFFDYHECSFKVENDKVNTARVIIWKEFKVANSFTLESSMYGYVLNSEVAHFAEREYGQIGEALLLALYDYDIIMGKLNKEAQKKPVETVVSTGIMEGAKQDSEETKEPSKKKEKLVTKLQMHAVHKVELVCSTGDNCEGSRAASCLGKYRSFEYTPSPAKKPRTEASKKPQRKPDPSWEEYFTEAELEEMMNGISSPEADEKSLSRRKTYSIADPETLPKNSEMAFELDQMRVPLHPKIMKMPAVQAGVAGTSLNPKEPISLNKRYVFESKLWNMKKASPQKEWRLILKKVNENLKVKNSS
eukprot:TRINITY_DN1310_c0_g1_i1.p1 TRINITY_DN1310_c0_g1~~TRINITY_DN1310_c0_g1_i1.p1  ORF type:complete len:872 (-),score=51.69 TRINITY_DN1310_c0_g1_i1:1512-3938(-)